MDRTPLPINGTGGHYHFPVNRHVTYLIRDVRDTLPTLVRTARQPRYQVFVLTGVDPTVEAHSIAIFRGAFADYAAACRHIEQMTRKVVIYPQQPFRDPSPLLFR